YDLASKSGEEEREEGEVGADEHHPEGDAAHRLTEGTPGHLRIPVVKGGKASKHGAADKGVVGGGGGIRRLMQLTANGDNRMGQLRDQANGNKGEGACGEDERGANHDGTAAQGREQVVEDEADGHDASKCHDHAEVKP